MEVEPKNFGLYWQRFAYGQYFCDVTIRKNGYFYKVEPKGRIGSIFLWVISWK